MTLEQPCIQLQRRTGKRVNEVLDVDVRWWTGTPAILLELNGWSSSSACIGQWAEDIRIMLGSDR
jgi:hypothetical protein